MMKIVESLYDRIVGRVSLHNVYDQDGNIIVSPDEMIVKINCSSN
jgi:hypothetical protein